MKNCPYLYTNDLLCVVSLSGDSLVKPSQSQGSSQRGGNTTMSARLSYARRRGRRVGDFVPSRLVTR